jgi:hypothetical protein
MHQIIHVNFPVKIRILIIYYDEKVIILMISHYKLNTTSIYKLLVQGFNVVLGYQLIFNIIILYNKTLKFLK